MVKSWLFDIFSYPYGTDGEAFSPQKCQELYDWHMDSWEVAEKAGFEGIFFSEHHYTPYCISPSPNLLIAAIAQRTKRIRLGVLVNVIPMHNPRSFAEEIAMLSYITHGRLEIGIGRGVDEREFKRENIPMEEVRARFEEGLRFGLTALNDPVFTHKGKFHTVGEETTLWPQPLTRPVNRPWVSSSSEETVIWAGANGHQIACAFAPLPKIKANLEKYIAAATSAGHPTGRENTMWMVPTFVADSDEEARAIAEPAMYRNIDLYRNALVFKDLDNLPKGYEDYKEIYRPFKEAGAASWEGLQEAGFAVVGSPKTVRDKLIEIAKFLGVGNITMWGCFGHMTPAQVKRSYQLIGEEVIPSLRALDPGTGRGDTIPRQWGSTGTAAAK